MPELQIRPREIRTDGASLAAFPVKIATHESEAWEEWRARDGRDNGGYPAVNRTKECRDGRRLQGRAAGLALCRTGFSPALGRWPRGLRRPLARNAGWRGVRLPAHRFAFH